MDTMLQHIADLAMRQAIFSNTYESRLIFIEAAAAASMT
jgi:hypothetical protein